MSAAPAPRRAGAATGWLLLALLLAWTAGVHHGVGPAPQHPDPPWHAPRAFLHASELGAALLDPPALAFATLWLPALLLAAGVRFSGGTPLASALALSALCATALFVFYGVVAPLPWRFFGWRGSATIGLVGLAVGFALAAPWLAGRWLALGPAARAASLAPFAAASVAFVRNATGTDPQLPFAISPWPAVPVFGLELAALCIAIAFAGSALGLHGSARRRAGAGGAPARFAACGAALFAACIAAPVALLAAASGLGLLPFRATPTALGALAAVCAGGALVGSRLAPRDANALRERARRTGVAAALIGIPLLAGQIWAWTDYHRTREIRARRIIDALETWFARETLYPDTLEELVAAGDLPRIPEPAIGFAALYDGRFEYQSFGTSFLLEFPAPRWVQCAYTPPPALDELEPEEIAELEAEGGLDEAWSCPSRPPELW